MGLRQATGGRRQKPDEIRMSMEEGRFSASISSDFEGLFHERKGYLSKALFWT